MPDPAYTSGHVRKKRKKNVGQLHIAEISKIVIFLAHAVYIVDLTYYAVRSRSVLQHIRTD